MSTTLSSGRPKHFLLATVPALGHMRAESGIVCELVKMDAQLTFTVLIPRAVAPVFTQELGQWSVPQGDLARIRIIGVGESEKPEAGQSFPWMMETLRAETSELREAYQSILGRGSLTCAMDGTVFDYQHIGAPSAVFCDMYAPAFAPYVKQTTPNVKVINAWVFTTGSILWHHGKEEDGGLFGWDVRTKAVFEKGEDGGRTFDEVAQSIRHAPRTGKLLPNADGVRMYDYEAGSDGVLPAPIVMGALLQATQYADASLITTTSGFEPGSTKVMRDWYEGQLGKKFFNFGPMVPFSAAPYKAPPLASQGAFEPVYSFLNAHPPKSVMLVSFGSIFFPTQAWQLEEIFKTLLETCTPFITSRAPAQYQPLDPELARTVEDSGLGLIVDYVPQRDILTHPSLGSFLSHGGNNSLFESIAAGVLNVFWPFDFDQPIHAAYMTDVLDCSWELLQVRTEEAMQPPARGGKIEGTPAAVAAEFKQVLSEIKGEVGERKRRNLQVLRLQTFDALKEGGEVQKDMRACLQLASGEA